MPVIDRPLCFVRIYMPVIDRPLCCVRIYMPVIDRPVCCVRICMPVIDGSLSDCRYQKVVAQGAADPEPRVVLGVLYNLSKEFDEAADVLRQVPGQADQINRQGQPLAYARVFG